MGSARLCLAAVSCLSIAACAGAPQHRLLPSENIDTQKVVTVNQWAEARGAQLIWVHYPTRDRAPSSD